MSNTEAIKDRILGREHTEEFLQFVTGGSEAYRSGVAAAMRAFADSILGKPESDLRVMSDEEAAYFEIHHEMKFGKHGGKSIKDVPIDYLAWLSDSTLPLSAYLRSDRGKARIEKEQ